MPLLLAVETDTMVKFNLCMKKWYQATLLDWHWKSGGHFTPDCMLPQSLYSCNWPSYTAICIRFAFDVTYANVAYATVKSDGCFICFANNSGPFSSFLCLLFCHVSYL